MTGSRVGKCVYEAVSAMVLNRFGGKRAALAMNTENSLALNLIQILSVCCLEYRFKEGKKYSEVHVTQFLI